MIPLFRAFAEFNGVANDAALMALRRFVEPGAKPDAAAIIHDADAFHA
jgi:hypothetical protein